MARNDAYCNTLRGLGGWPLLVLTLLALNSNAGSAAPGTDKATEQPRTAGPSILEWKFLDVNQINCTIASDGPFADYRLRGNSGLEWPRGSGKTALFTAGIWITGRHVPTDSLRTANMDYSTEFQPGPLLETFNTSTLDDAAPRARASDPRYRLYKIQRGDSVSQDYLEWPGDLGAPFVDVNENGQWDPSIDRPRFYGDLQLWAVMNDVNVGLHTSLGATPPMGIEVRALFYAVDRPGVLQNTMFMEWMVINRSDADYQDLFVSLWCDPDLGDANDDLPGSDSTLGLGYVYNGDNDDGTSHGYGSQPPAAGFLFLAGPVVPGSPGDSARLGEHWFGNHLNLPATSYISYFGASWRELIDPPDGSPYYSRIAHDYQLGKAGTAGEYLRRPDSSFYPLFWLSGDPVTGTGDLPQNFPLGVVHPQDLRMLLNSGPCSLASGDTQYFAGAFMVAQGTDRLNSITLLRDGVGRVREFFAHGRAEVPQRQLIVTPGVIVFDSTQVGGTTRTHGIALSSVGHESISVLQIDAPDPDTYSMTAPPAPLSLDSGETAAISLQFVPGTRGYHPDSLVVVTNDTSRPRQYVYLDGWGYTMFPAAPGVMYGAGTTFEAIDPTAPDRWTVGVLPSSAWGMTVRPGSGVVYLVRPEARGGSALCRACTENLDLLNAGSIPLPQLKAMAFSPDQRLFAGTNDGRLFRVELETGDTVSVGASSQGGYNALTFNPQDGSLWGCAYPAGLYNRDRILKVDTTSGEASIVGNLGNNRPILSLTFGPDGTLYALQTDASAENTLYRVDTLTGQGTLIGTLGVYGLSAIAMRVDQPVGGITERPTGTPSTWALSQNFPNPFNPTTRLGYELPQAAKVRITVFDILGREIRTLVNGQHGPGTFYSDWDARDDNGVPVSSGTYLVRMEAVARSGQGAMVFRKIVYLK